jgi:hypothetical protein
MPLVKDACGPAYTGMRRARFSGCTLNGQSLAASSAKRTAGFQCFGT